MELLNRDRSRKNMLLIFFERIFKTLYATFI